MNIAAVISGTSIKWGYYVGLAADGDSTWLHYKRILASPLELAEIVKTTPEWCQFALMSAELKWPPFVVIL